MGSTSNVTGSSNNPRSFESIMRRITRNRDSRTNSNPGRSFFGCPNYNRWCELFLWIDKILEDVIICDGRTNPSIDNKE
ncbi:hypothetical protein Ahy_B04g072809 [Arachis hypogaea]|uniref:Uncharacterized protein n=1 Tax=Arachis hypogaea TaxID=3818 RepID=A0A444ZNU5_ARAHY|nr:hypothetical protein Ahy_B04g072809 [Arachis hypogaea]